MFSELSGILSVSELSGIMTLSELSEIMTLSELSGIMSLLLLSISFVIFNLLLNLSEFWFDSVGLSTL